MYNFQFFFLSELYTYIKILTIKYSFQIVSGYIRRFYYTFAYTIRKLSALIINDHIISIS